MKLVIPMIALLAGLVELTAMSACYGDTPAKAAGTNAPPVTRDQVAPTERLGQVPVIKLGPQPPVTPQEAAKIRRLIADLAKVDSPDYGLSPTLSGTAFAPVPGAEHAAALLITNHGIKPSQALHDLVAMGPRALPFLLDALDDSTPTRLTIRHNGMFGVMEFSHEIWANPANSAEQKALNSVPKSQWGATQSPDDLVRLPTRPDAPLWTPRVAYTVRVGDVCFVAIGQITGRGYDAVRYQPTMCIYINSPVHDPSLAAQVRAVWARDNLSQHLLDSLLLDYTVGEQDADPVFRSDAAMRLSYYFPRQFASMNAARLRRLGVHAPPQLINDVSWCREPLLRGVLQGIFQQTTDPARLVASLPAMIPEYTRQALTRMDSFLRRLPATEAPYGDGYDILVSLGRDVGEPVKPSFKRYLQRASTQRCITMCRALREIRPGWDIELLAPLLADRRLDYSESHPIDPSRRGPSLVTRVCDMAAETVNLNHPDLPFRMTGRYTDLDRQIAAMRERIKKGQR